MDVLSHREWMQLRQQFQQVMPPKCKRPDHLEVADAQCHGYHPNWAWARYCIETRQWREMR